MTLRRKSVVSIFDKYSLVIPPNMKCHQDGLPEQRVYFISDKKERVVISFDEGGQMTDIPPDAAMRAFDVSYQYCKDGKYIRQTRNAEGNITYSFFQIVLEDENGKRHCLSGQIVVEKGYVWLDGVEPVLMELMEGLSVCRMEKES